MILHPWASQVPILKSLSNGIGKVIKAFVQGQDHITGAKAYLERCVDNYSKALSNIVGIRMLIKVWEIVRGTF